MRKLLIALFILIITPILSYSIPSTPSTDTPTFTSTTLGTTWHGYGAGSPEGVVTAPIGSTYHRTNGSSGTTLYVKESGSGNTGWVAIMTGSSIINDSAGNGDTTAAWSADKTFDQLALKSDSGHNHTGTYVPVGNTTYAFVTGSNDTTTGQNLVDIAGLSVALAASSTYEFTACLSVASSSSAGNKYGVNFSAAGAAVEGQESGTNAATTYRSGRISALNTAGGVMPAAAADAVIRLQGIVTTGANAGNFTVQHLKVTSGTATCYINSFLKVTKVN